MYDELLSRFEAEVTSSIEDPDIHLSYTDKQRLKRGEYADVAADKLPTLDRRIWWAKMNAGVAAVLLVLGAILTGFSGLGVGADWTMEEFAFPLFFAFCMGVAAVGGLWRMQKLESSVCSVRSCWPAARKTPKMRKPQPRSRCLLDD